MKPAKRQTPDYTHQSPPFPEPSRRISTLLRHGIVGAMIVTGSHGAVAQEETVAAAHSFQREVHPILEQSCVSCHGPAKQKADLRVDRREDLLRDRGAATLVHPGDSGASRLVAVISGGIQPKRKAKDHLLSPQEIALIRSWIDSGAK